MENKQQLIQQETATTFFNQAAISTTAQLKLKGGNDDQNDSENVIIEDIVDH